MEKADTQFYIASKDFKVIKVKIIERKLNAGHNQQGFQDKVFIGIEPYWVTKKTMLSPKDHHYCDKSTLQEEESNFVNRYILVKNFKYHFE